MPRLLHFQDWGFRHRFAPVHTPHGKVLRWIPFGMPRVSYAVQTTIFYLFGRDPRTGELKGPYGTGVLVCRDTAHNRHIYAVTAYHVAVTGGISCIRLNTAHEGPDGKSYGSSRIIELEPSQWTFIPNSDDLAAIDITDEMQTTEVFDFASPMGEDELLTEEFAADVELAEGEDGFMLGLFVPSSGGEMNRPAMRFGNIAQIPDAEMPVEQGNGIKRPSYVFDMRSRPGYSGSPVFVFRTPDHDLRDAYLPIDDSPAIRITTKDNLFVRLLGIHSGQFEEEITATKAEAFSKEPIHDGDCLTVPSSMTVVAPAWRISALLDHPHFKEQRVARDARQSKFKKPKVRPEVAEAVAVPDNPSHKEDFKRLLGAAVKANKPAS